MTDETTQTPEAPAEAPASLQMQDILGAAQCIQLASTRGAFRAEELSQVGGVYDRLVGFMQASGALQPAPQTDAPADAPAAQ